jgi:NADPH-dependent curcumin reductase CurA
MRAILSKRLLLRGFIVSDFASQHGEFQREVGAWLRDGKIKYREDVVEGLDNAPQASSASSRARTSASCSSR